MCLFSLHSFEVGTPTVLYRWLNLGAERCSYFTSMVLCTANTGWSEEWLNRDSLTSGSPLCSRAITQHVLMCQAVSIQTEGGGRASQSQVCSGGLVSGKRLDWCTCV